MDETETPKKKTLSPERLAKLALARKAALEARTKVATIKKHERDSKKADIETKYNNIVKPKVVEEPKAVEEVKEVESVPKKTKKTKKKVIVVSSSDDESAESSESEPEIEYVIKRNSKRTSKAKPVKQPKEYEHHELTATVARDILRTKIMDRTNSEAFKSIFPYHNF